MCRLGITIAPRGEMIMKSKMTVNCKNPRMPITTFSYRENLIRAGARVTGLSMRFLCQESDPKALARAYGILLPIGLLVKKVTVTEPMFAGRSDTCNPNGSHAR